MKVILQVLFLATVASPVITQGSPDPVWDIVTNTNEFQTQPRRALVRPGGSITLLGKMDTPLQRCHFYLPSPLNTFLDFSKGAASKSTDQYEYFGSGLENGDCGIHYKNAEDTDDGIVECKVKAVGSSKWERCVTTLRVTDVSEEDLPVFNIVPRTATLSRGDNITITCNADRSINMCHIYLPGPRYLNFDQGPSSRSTNEYKYHGDGLDSGHCGATLTGVDDRLTGYVVCKLGQWPEQVTGAWETDALKITTTKNNINSTPVRVGVSTVSQPQTPSTTLTPTQAPSNSCPPLHSEFLIINCTFAGEPSDCNERQPIGAIAKLACKPGYAKPPTISYKRVICRRNGQWDHPLFNCAAECGRRKTNKGHVLISGGQEGEIGEFPWHVGFFERKENTYGQMCGGSLITPKLVLTAAHCFWDSGANGKKNVTLYKMVAGKHIRSWEDDNPSLQITDVSNIIIPSLFRGRFTNFAPDIAIAQSATPFQITAAVNLICVDWDSAFEKSQLQTGNEGIVTGWGYTEEGALSEILKYVQLPYIPPTACLDGLPRDLQPLLTYDKFCAGYVNQSISVCRGDSGGGLVFRHPETGQYFLRGVVSVAFTPAGIKSICYAQFYTGFTRISKHQEWILANL